MLMHIADRALAKAVTHRVWIHQVEGKERVVFPRHGVDLADQIGDLSECSVLPRINLELISFWEISGAGSIPLVMPVRATEDTHKEGADLLSINRRRSLGARSQHCRANPFYLADFDEE